MVEGSIILKKCDCDGLHLDGEELDGRWRFQLGPNVLRRVVDLGAIARKKTMPDRWQVGKFVCVVWMTLLVLVVVQLPNSVLFCLCLYYMIISIHYTWFDFLSKFLSLFGSDMRDRASAPFHFHQMLFGSDMRDRATVQVPCFTFTKWICCYEMDTQILKIKRYFSPTL